MTRDRNRSKDWSRLKQHLRDASPAKLIEIIRDLHQLSPENRRFLEARFSNSNGTLERYRELIREAINPDPTSRKVTSISEAKRLIQEYERATHDPAAVVDLRLAFVEAGTEQAVEYGAGDEKYFASTISMLNLMLKSLWNLPEEQRRQYIPRLRQLCDYGACVAWGYGDYLSDTLEQTLADMDEEDG